MEDDEEIDFLDWWDKLDDIERSEYSKWCKEIENEET